MDINQSTEAALDDLSTDRGFKMFSELAGDRLGISPTALKPFMMAMALEVGAVMLNEQLSRIMAAVESGNPVKLAIQLQSAQQTLDHFTAMAIEAGQRVGMDRAGQSWPEVVEDAPTN